MKAVHCELQSLKIFFKLNPLHLTLIAATPPEDSVVDAART
jgi:hypothetical protein